MFMDIPADENFYDQMARTFIEEYMMMGWADDEILALFHEPYYRGTYDILQKKGEEFVKNLIDEVRRGPLSPCGRGKGEGEAGHG